MKIKTIMIRCRVKNKILDTYEPVILIDIRAYVNPSDPNSKYYESKHYMTENIGWKQMLKYTRYLKQCFLMDIAKETDN